MSYVTRGKRWGREGIGEWSRGGKVGKGMGKSRARRGEKGDERKKIGKGIEREKRIQRWKRGREEEVGGKRERGKREGEDKKKEIQ